MRTLPRILSATLTATILSACGSPPPPASSSQTPPAATAEAPSHGGPALGNFGFDSAGMDRAVSPGDDFFAYANGGWVAATEIPADRSRWNSFSVLAEQALKDTRAIAEEAASQSDATGDRARIGAFHAAFMDEVGIESAGIAPLQSALDAIVAIGDKDALTRALGASLRADVDLLNSTDYYTPNLFGLWVSVNLLRPDEYAPYLVQGGLGMPDRDFYLEDGRMAELRTQYADYLARLFELAGIEEGKARADRVLALETEIARVHASQLDTNDVQKGANEWAASDFSRRAPGMNWLKFFEAADLGPQTSFIVWQPEAVTGIAALVESQPLDVWKDWLAAHVMDAAAPYLPKTFADAHFDFHDHALSGTPQQQERWKRSVSELNAALGEAVGRIYVERHFPAQTKARAEAMVANVIRAFGQRIDALEWMTAATKNRARIKLEGLDVSLGYPERWRDYSGLDIRRDDALGNVQRAGVFEYRRNVSKLGRPVDHDEWFMLPQVVNALNVPLENRLIFPAAILQPPFFDGEADDAVNYGAIGAVIGHEISHSFDNSGALFDENGKLSNWWTPEDLAHFDAASAALAAQFDTYRPFPDLAINGKLTLGENIADVAGLASAYDAYRLAHPDEDAEIDGFSPDQRLFLGWAQAWRVKAREPALRNSILTGVHAPGQYRAQTVRNLDAWYPAFEVTPDQALYLKPEERVKIW